MVKSNLLKNIKNINCHFFNFTESNSEKVMSLRNRSYSCQQIHNRNLSLIKSKKFYQNSDGLVSNKKSVLEIRTADCMPIFIYAPNSKIIAALHVGWRGLYKGIIFKTAKLLESLDKKINTMFVSIGPHIGVCCYEVSYELIFKFEKKFKLKKSFYDIKNKKYFLNLSNIVNLEFIALGFSKFNIEDTQVCTKCNLEFASYRRNKTKLRNLSFLELL